MCRDIAAASGAVVVSVEYRLAPEHPYPAPLEDCLGVTRRLPGIAHQVLIFAVLDVAGVADLRGLPPATIVTAEYDPLRDENEAYARMLQAAGVPVALRHFDGQVHPFHLIGGLIGDAIVARKWIGERLRTALA